MVTYFQNKYALSEQGAKDLQGAILWTFLQFIGFWFPLIISFKFLDEHITALVEHLPLPGADFLFYALLSLLLFALMFGISYMQYDATYTKIYEESAKSRINLAETLRKLPLAFFGKRDIADLSATLMDDTTQIETLFSHAIPQLYAAGANILLMATLTFFFDWRLALALFWVVPVALLVFSFSRKMQKSAHRKLYDIKRTISDKVQEGLDQAQEIKAYNGESAYSNALNAQLDGYERLMVRSELLIGAAINLSYSILYLGLPTLLLYGGYLLIQNEVSVFVYIVFLVIAARVYTPIMDVMANFALLLYLSVRIDRLKEMNAMPRQLGRTEFQPPHFDITFDRVHFSYDEDSDTLNDISFTAKQGEVTALIGPSGGGKTTIAKLAARFWDINAGTITLGGEDISQIDPETLLQHYAIVFQDVTLFNTSVLENIRLGKKGASDEEVLAAARLAQCDAFALNLPEGYHTRIGENGERLSGGERQRISIARAILKDAPIILLDEATASLDTENESKIQRALSEMVRNKTVLIIAHRMRTISAADKIIVVKDGQIAETGKPSELKEKDSLFRAMCQTQGQML